MEQTMGFEGLKRGMKARVVGVSGEGDDTKRLMELGLTPGSEFTVTKIAPLGDPVEISLRGYRLCLRKREAQEILLELVG